MGCFSSLAIDYEETYEDDSWYSPERQLSWRLEDLKGRYEELTENGAPYRNENEGLCLTADDVRYAIASYFECIADVERAIDLTVSDLQSKYNVHIADRIANEKKFMLCIPFIKRQHCSQKEHTLQRRMPLNAA